MAFDEQWKPVESWAGVYEVSDLGRVRSVHRARVNKAGQSHVYPVRVLQPHLCNGYQRVNLKDGDRLERAYVHRLVCSAFHGPAPEGHEVAHGDGNRNNPAAENLRWATRSENFADKNRHGTDNRGEKCWVAKLSDEAVAAIREQFGHRSLTAIAREYGVAPSTLSALRHGHTWRHV